MYSGTTIGYKKICELTPEEVITVRVVFKEFRVAPVIRHVGLY